MESEKVIKANQNPYLLSTPQYAQFSGGLNMRSAYTEILLNQLQAADNIRYHQSGALLPRPGARYVSLSQYDQTTGFCRGAIDAYGDKYLVIGTQIFHLNVATWVNITGALTRAMSNAPTRTRFATYLNYIIGVDSENVPFKIDTSTKTASVLNASAPSGEFITVWNDYVFIAGVSATPGRLYFSAKGDPTTWTTSTDFIEINGAQDNDPIMGFGVAYGTLIIFKKYSIFALTGTSSSDFSLSEISREIGMACKGASCQVELSCWYVSSSGIFSIGSDLKPTLRSYWVEPIFNTYLQPHWDNNPVTMAYYVRDRQVWISCCYQSSDETPVYNKTIVFDTRSVDAMGQPAISLYKFYTTTTGTPVVDDTTKNMNPICLFRSGDWLFWTSKTGYIYGLDTSVVSCTDTYAPSTLAVYSESCFKTKYLCLGDPNALKCLRFLRFTGKAEPVLPYIEITLTDGADLTTVIKFNSWTAGSRATAPAAATANTKFVSVGLRSKDGPSNWSICGLCLEYINFGRRI